MKTKNVVKAMLMLSLSASTFSQAMANGTLNNDPININGYMQEEVVPTDAELENVNNELRKTKNAIIINKQKKKSYNDLSRKTEKLAEETEELIEERKEYKKIVEENNKKIDCLMADGMKAGCEDYVRAPREDRVSTAQAAPKAQVSEAPLAAPVGADSFGGTIKVLPYTGLTSFFTENENLEGSLVGGVKVETNINPKFSVGVGFNYTTLKTTDYGGNGYYDAGFYDVYTGAYGSGGREIEYSNMNFSIYSKYFIVKNDRFRPYVGAGLGYNRSTLEYTNNNNARNYYDNSYWNYQFGNEEVTTSSINLDLSVGSEIKFTKSMGANVELNYMRSLGGNLSNENAQNPYFAPDQERLNDLAEELGESNIISVYAALLVEF